MTSTLLPNAKQTFTGPNGTPLSGGSVYFYIPGTTTPKNTYQDAEQTILNPNPIVLDANGQAVIWGSGAYRQMVYDVNGNLIWDQVTQDANAGLTGGITDDVFIAGTDFTPGTTTELELTVGPGSLANTWIFFDGTYQDDAQATLSNLTTLTFASPIPVGVQKVTVKIGGTVAIGTPGAGTIADAAIAANAAINSAKLSYVQGAAGSLARTVQNRLQDYVSVMDFGAKGDGATDDSDAFQAAANTGKSIWLPAASYVLNSTINVTLSGTRFVGAGRGAVAITTNSTGHAFAVATGLTYIEFSDFQLLRNGVPGSNAQNGIHFTGLTERARIARVESTGHWNNFRLCATSLSYTENLFSNNAYGDGIYQTNEDAVAAGLQWEHTRPFVQQSNGWGIHIKTSFGSTANLGPISGFWTYANKGGGIYFNGQSGYAMNGARLLGGFSGQEGFDSIYVDTYGSTDIQISGVQTEINGTSACGVNGSTAATNQGRGFTITANNTNAFVTGCTGLGHSNCGILTSCPRNVITGSTFRANGAARNAGEVTGIFLQAGRAVVSGNSSLGQQFGIFFNVDNNVIVGNDVSEGNSTPIGGAVSPTASFISNNLGSTLVSPP